MQDKISKYRDNGQKVVGFVSKWVNLYLNTVKKQGLTKKEGYFSLSILTLWILVIFDKVLFGGVFSINLITLSLLLFVHARK